MGWWLGLHQPPWSFGFYSQTRGTRENRVTPCVKVQGSSRVPAIVFCNDTRGNAEHLNLVYTLVNTEDMEEEEQLHTNNTTDQ